MPGPFCGIEPDAPVFDAEAVGNTPFYNSYTGRNRIQGHLLPASTAAAISPCRY